MWSSSPPVIILIITAGVTVFHNQPQMCMIIAIIADKWIRVLNVYTQYG